MTNDDDGDDDDEWPVTWTMMSMNDDDMDNDQQSTHPHTDKQLLIRWIVGAPGLYNDEDAKGTTNDKWPGNNKQLGKMTMDDRQWCTTCP
jgi:hypothetical protein